VIRFTVINKKMTKSLLIIATLKKEKRLKYTGKLLTIAAEQEESRKHECVVKSADKRIPTERSA